MRSLAMVSRTPLPVLPPAAIARPSGLRTQDGQFGARALRVMARNWPARFCADWAALLCLWQVPGIESGGGLANKLFQPSPDTHVSRAQGAGDGGEGIATRGHGLRKPFLGQWNTARISARRGLQGAGPVGTDKRLDLTATFWVLGEVKLGAAEGQKETNRHLWPQCRHIGRDLGRRGRIAQRGKTARHAGPVPDPSRTRPGPVPDPCRTRAGAFGRGLLPVPLVGAFGEGLWPGPCRTRAGCGETSEKGTTARPGVRAGRRPRSRRQGP